MSLLAFDALHFQKDDRWLRVPAWARYYAFVGSIAVGALEPNMRLVVALSVPSRSYVAALTSAGIVTTSAEIPVIRQTSKNHFVEICNLPANTPVSLVVLGPNGSHLKKKGVFAGLSNYGGSPCAIIMVNRKSAGGGSHLIREEDSDRVEILPTGPVDLPKKQTGKLIRGMSAFGKAFFRSKEAQMSLRESRLDCLIVGRINALHREIEETPLAVDRSRKLQVGTLGDVLRVRRFIRDGEPFTSDVIRVRGHSLDWINESYKPSFIVFDGATAFIRWHSRVRDRNWLVILDRTETSFREAADILNEAYLRRLTDKQVNFPAPPKGIEVMSYHERR
jgi:hypothetical protein